MKKNAPELWDNIWKEVSIEEDLFNLKREENSIRWQRIESIILSEFGSFRNLKVIKLGAGAGTNGALMAKRGANVTILDYSEKALERSRTFFESHNLSAQCLLQDALKLDESLFGLYDVSMSFGLAEHFKGDNRIRIIRSHFDLLRNGGISFISVPNKFNLSYRIYKFIAEAAGKWSVGEEYPFSRWELANIIKEIGIENYTFFGDSIYSSLNFINPMELSKKIFNIKKNFDLDLIKKERGSKLDQYFSYALVLCGKKQITQL